MHGWGCWWVPHDARGVQGGSWSGWMEHTQYGSEIKVRHVRVELASGLRQEGDLIALQ